MAEGSTDLPGPKTPIVTAVPDPQSCFPRLKPVLLSVSLEPISVSYRIFM